MKARAKYGNKKTVINGQKFDSKLELFMFNYLTAHKIPFRFQFPLELIPAHKINGKAIRKAEIIVDFIIITKSKKVIYVDTKGFATALSKLKYKMLGFKLLENNDPFEIVWLKTKVHVLEFVNQLKTDKYE